MLQILLFCISGRELLMLNMSDRNDWTTLNLLFLHSTWNFGGTAPSLTSKTFCILFNQSSYIFDWMMNFGLWSLVPCWSGILNYRDMFLSSRFWSPIHNSCVHHVDWIVTLHNLPIVCTSSCYQKKFAIVDDKKVDFLPKLQTVEHVTKYHGTRIHMSHATCEVAVLFSVLHLILFHSTWRKIFFGITQEIRGIMKHF